MEKTPLETPAELTDYYIDLFASHLSKLNDFSKKINTQSDSIKKKQNPNADFSDYAEMHKLNGFNALLSVSLLDLSTIIKNIFNATKNWEFIFFVKQGYLTIYETLKSYDYYNQILHGLVTNKYPAAKKSFLEISKLIKKYKSDFDYNGQMQKIRNYTTGHIDQNYEIYYATILSMDAEKGALAMTTFLPILFKLQEFSTELGAVATAHQKQNQLPK